jgi:hypothetical protein
VSKATAERLVGRAKKAGFVLRDRSGYRAAVPHTLHRPSVDA